MYIQYDPKKHKDEQLYKLVSVVSKDGTEGTVIAPVEDSEREQADETPWYYFVGDTSTDKT